MLLFASHNTARLCGPRSSATAIHLTRPSMPKGSRRCVTLRHSAVLPPSHRLVSLPLAHPVVSTILRESVSRPLGAPLRMLLACAEHAELQETCLPVERSGKPLRPRCRCGHVDAARAAAHRRGRSSRSASRDLTKQEGRAMAYGRNGAVRLIDGASSGSG